MTNKIRGIVLILALVLSTYSIVSIFNSPNTADAKSNIDAQGGSTVDIGIECVLGPGNCGCYQYSDTCQSHWHTLNPPQHCQTGGKNGYWYYTEYYTQEHYQNGLRAAGNIGGATMCVKIGISPPQWYPWCNTTCGW